MLSISFLPGTLLDAGRWGGDNGGQNVRDHCSWGVYIPGRSGENTEQQRMISVTNAIKKTKQDDVTEIGGRKSTVKH